MGLRHSIYQGHRPPENTRGVNVVIDVIRAFTTAHVAYLKGVESILLVDSVDQGFALKREVPNSCLVGEVGGISIPGYDFGNSPAELSRADLAGKCLILKTTNGVRSTLNAMTAERVFVTGFCNIQALVKYLKQLGVLSEFHVQIIASHPSGLDDLICAELIAKGLYEDLTDSDFEKASKDILRTAQAKKFLDPDNPDYNSEDMLYCCSLADPQLVIEALKGNEIVFLREVSDNAKSS